jgi:hypothetical protein
MAISWRFDESTQLFWVTFEHPYAKADVRELVAYTTSQSPPMDTVVDLSRLSRATLETHCVRELARRLPVNPKIVTFIAPTLSVFARARMFESISELQEGSGPRGVFRNEAEAMEWLQAERLRREIRNGDSAQENFSPWNSHA